MVERNDGGPVVYIAVDKDGWTGGIQVSINVEEEGKGGHGYRLAGPKFNGSSKQLKRRDLDARDIREIERYLKIAKEGLAKEVEGG